MYWCLWPLALHSTTYQTFEMDVMLDDTVRRVTSIHQRGQVGPEDVSALVSLDQALDICKAPGFPEQDMTRRPERLDSDAVYKNQKAWCKARSTGEDS